MAVVDNADAAPVAAPDAPAHRPPGLVKLSYSLGQLVESGYLAVNGFVFFYYTAVLGLSGSLVGAAVAISMCLDAAADPLIGSWSDSVRSRFGRRLPVMLVGAPLTAITMGLLFAPPSGLSPFLMFLWLTMSKMSVRAFASMYNIPYFALGGEMSDDYAERSKIVAQRLLAGIIITVVINALAFSHFFAGEGGLQSPDRYPAFGWSIAAVVLVGALLCCAGVWRFAAGLHQPEPQAGSMFRRLPGEIVEIFRDRSFRILFISMLLFTSAAGVHAALANHTYVFVWKLKTETIQFISYASLLGITVGVPLTTLLLRRIEKKTAVIIGFALVIVAWTVLPFLRASGVFRPEGAEALAWILPNAFVVGVGSGLIFIAYPSMMADAAEEHEHARGVRREGLYFAGLGFAGKAAGGVGTLVAGLALDVLNFPREAGRQLHAAISEPVLSSLVLAWAPLPALFGAFGLLIIFHYAISRERHAEIVADLKMRRAGRG